LVGLYGVFQGPISRKGSGGPTKTQLKSWLAVKHVQIILIILYFIKLTEFKSYQHFNTTGLPGVLFSLLREKFASQQSFKGWKTALKKYCKVKADDLL